MEEKVASRERLGKEEGTPEKDERIEKEEKTVTTERDVKVVMAAEMDEIVVEKAVTKI